MIKAGDYVRLNTMCGIAKTLGEGECYVVFHLDEFAAWLDYEQLTVITEAEYAQYVWEHTE